MNLNGCVIFGNAGGSSRLEWGNQLCAQGIHCFGYTVLKDSEHASPCCGARWNNCSTRRASVAYMTSSIGTSAMLSSNTTGFTEKLHHSKMGKRRLHPSSDPLLQSTIPGLHCVDDCITYVQSSCFWSLQKHGDNSRRYRPDC